MSEFSHLHSVRIDVESETIWSKSVTFTEDYLKHNIYFSLTKLFGDIGSGFAFDVKNLDLKKRIFTLETDHLKEVRSALTLSNTFQGVQISYVFI